MLCISNKEKGTKMNYDILGPVFIVALPVHVQFVLKITQKFFIFPVSLDLYNCFNTLLVCFHGLMS